MYLSNTQYTEMTCILLAFPKHQALCMQKPTLVLLDALYMTPNELSGPWTPTELG